MSSKSNQFTWEKNKQNNDLKIVLDCIHVKVILMVIDLG